MTLKARILAHLAAHYGQSFTNRELATALGVPEPSVRRATLKAVTTFPGGQIVDSGGSGYARSPFRYTAPTPTPTVEATQL